MNTVTNPDTSANNCGLAFDQIQSLTAPARALYNQIFDYCTYAADPRYQTLHKFRQAIARIANTADRDTLIAYFNADPAIQDPNMKVPAWQYFADAYWINMIVCLLYARQVVQRLSPFG